MRDIIQIKNLVKKFGDFTAINGIDLNIREGEIFGLLGPNGAGKTTAINVILGLLKPTQGSVIIDGMDNQKHRSEIKKLIGMMMQETVVENELTAKENLTLFANLYHMPEEQIPSRVRYALEEADLVEFKDKKASTFSGGMKRRLELVKSMIHTPKILILDEPTTGLDVQNRTNMWEHIRGLTKEGITVIMTTQYLEEADALCDRIAIVDHGKIKAIGTASELKALVGTGDVLEIISDKENVEKIASLLKKLDFNPIVRVDKITVVLGKNSIKMMNRIVSEIERNKLFVLSISMHLPTLDDVLIKLTGQQLRDTVSEGVSTMTKMMKR